MSQEKASQAKFDSDTPPASQPKPKKLRGFATMTPEERSAIARKGGLAAHRQGAAHEFTRDEAREAGVKGGQATSRDREHMREIGRKGGAARKGYRAFK